MEENTHCQILENCSLDEVPITPKEYNNILNIQNKVLDMIASHATSTEVLEQLCTMAEGLLPNSVASVMLKDSSGLLSVLCAPSVPQVGHDALKNLQPGRGIVWKCSLS